MAKICPAPGWSASGHRARRRPGPGVRPRRYRGAVGRLFRLLQRPSTESDRHRSLRATIAWGHDLLSLGAQIVLRRPAVFVGSFDLGAAESVCAHPGLDIADVVSLLGELVSNSLVVRDSWTNCALQAARDSTGVRPRAARRGRRAAGRQLNPHGVVPRAGRRRPALMLWLLASTARYRGELLAAAELCKQSLSRFADLSDAPISRPCTAGAGGRSPPPRRYRPRHRPYQVPQLERIGDRRCTESTLKNSATLPSSRAITGAPSTSTLKAVPPAEAWAAKAASPNAWKGWRSSARAAGRTEEAVELCSVWRAPPGDLRGGGLSSGTSRGRPPAGCPPGGLGAGARRRYLGRGHQTEPWRPLSDAPPWPHRMGVARRWFRLLAVPQTA